MTIASANAHRLVMTLAGSLLLTLGACAPRPVSAVINVREAWLPPPGALPAALSAGPARYDYNGIRVLLNGQPTEPDAALDTVSRHLAQELGQVTSDGGPVAARATIVLPDHDRLRPLAGQIVRQVVGPAADFEAELLRVDLHGTADAIARAGVFGDVAVEQRNDTTAPDPTPGSALIWFQVRSATPANTGPWIGRWLMRRPDSARVEPIGLDVGTPAGPARMASLARGIRAAYARPAGSAVAVDPNAGTTLGPGAAPGTRRLASSGSGFFVDAEGHVLTNNHVIAGCPDMRVTGAAGASTPASVAGADAANDLALLTTHRPAAAWAVFHDSRALRAGEPVVVTGFPLAGVLSPEMAVTTGSITALGGGGGDPRQFQFSAPVQPGNSGGPVLDESGRVIGIASAELNAGLMALAGGVMPQNVNFAIKTDIAAGFLATNHVTPKEGKAVPPLDAASIGDRARAFTVKIECWR